ncbi:MurR/RpiR family transcriptional regulator GlvR [Tetragenococcus halophilus]|uniref:MurR/RpiR family transcriptional regulator n=1 Tax=Tetragenococcus halophilus TaxID=51669 RepID=UPI00256E15C1|nr:MurR/RpiR family transcriptional regulator [Tetragenococcus halophilus]GMG64414.1 MurR/RpiR family transcriptional regulator GlvR [Tetragenococcus halophilus]
MRLEERINQVSSFSNIEYVLLEYIISAKSKIIYMQATELASNTYTSPASITRLSKKLGFSGFNEFKFFLKQEVNERRTNKNKSWQLLQSDIEKTIHLTEETNLLPINRLIAEAKNIFVFGTDWGEHNTAELFARNFMALDIYMTVIPSITELRWVSEKVQKNDVILIISYSGEGKDVTEISQLLKLKKVKIISVTPLTRNHLSNLSSHNLYYQATQLEGVSDDPNAEYNLFTTLHVVLDALFRNYFDNFYQ